MEEPVFVKCEPAWPSDTEEPFNFEENDVQPSDNQVKIKEDPHAEVAGLRLQEVNINVVTGPCSDEPSANVKDEIFREEHAVNEQVPCFEEENNVVDATVSTRCPVHPYDGCCNSSSQHTITHRLVTPTEKDLYSCPICKSAFDREDDLRNHLSAHSAERQYCCNICNRVFSRKSTLADHLSTHSVDRPYSCSICNNAFSLKVTLKNHLLTHSQVKPFSCNICSRSFSKNWILKRHLVTHS